MNDARITALRKVLSRAIEGETKLKIISLQGPYDCILIKKVTVESETTMIHVRTLKNDNPSFEENNTLSIALNDG